MQTISVCPEISNERSCVASYNMHLWVWCPVPTLQSSSPTSYILENAPSFSRFYVTSRFLQITASGLQSMPKTDKVSSEAILCTCRLSSALMSGALISRCNNAGYFSERVFIRITVLLCRMRVLKLQFQIIFFCCLNRRIFCVNIVKIFYRFALRKYILGVFSQASL